LSYTAVAAGVGDFDGDGTLDLAVNSALRGTNAVVILLGNGDGTFRQTVKYEFGATVDAPVVADFRGNGDLDLAVAEPLAGDVLILLGNGDGTFGEPTTYHPSSFVAGVMAGDFNGDGKLDLAAAEANPSGAGILLGNGDGTFRVSTYSILPVKTHAMQRRQISTVTGRWILRSQMTAAWEA